MTTTTRNEAPSQSETDNETRTSPRRHRLAAAAIALAVGGAALLGGASAASASLSPYVNTTYQNFGGWATDCTAYAGAFYRSDKMVQGDAQVPCNLRHKQTEVYVRLIRYYQGYYYGGWKRYVYSNSYGTGALDLLTDPLRICGYAWWKTQVYATVMTGYTSYTVNFTNNWQQYDPCA